MTKILNNIIVSFIIGLLIIPFTVLATPVSLDYTNNILQPFKSMWGKEFRISYLNATSTTATSTFAGKIKIADDSSAIFSDDYSMRFKSGIQNSANNDGFVFDTTNLMDNTNASIVKFKSGGNDIGKIRYGEGFGSAGADAFLIDGQGASLFSGLALNTAFLGTVWFSANSQTGNRLGVFPNWPAFVSETSPTGANVATINFSAGSGAYKLFDFKLSSTTGSFVPYSTASIPYYLGENMGDTPNGKYKGLYLTDSGGLHLGDNKDASIEFNGSDLLIDPQAGVASVGDTIFSQGDVLISSLGECGNVISDEFGTLACGTTNRDEYPSWTWPGYATTTSATTTIPLGMAFVSEAWYFSVCKVTSGTGGYRYGDGTNWMGYVGITSTPSNDTLSGSNLFSAEEERIVEIGPMNNAMITCTIHKRLFI